MWICNNGTFYPQHQPTLSLLDRGLRWGDGLFETIRIENRTPLCITEHWQRITNSASHFSIPLLISQEILHDWSIKLIQKNQIQSGVLRWILTRGAVDSSGMKFHPDLQSQWYIEANPMEFTPITWKLSFAKFSRSKTSPITPHKSVNYLENLFALHIAEKSGFDEALFCVEQGVLQEGTKSNLFWVKQKEVFTPAYTTGLLGGITRQAIVEIAKGEGVRVYEVEENAESLQKADEIFMTNSLQGIIPVTQLENQERKKGKITTLLQKKLKDYWSKIASS